MRKSIIRNYLIAVISLAAVTSQANAYCSCWSSTNSRANGATCGAGLNLDSGALDYVGCEIWCKRNTHDDGHLWAYTDWPAFKACKESFAYVTRNLSARDCWLVEFELLNMVPDFKAQGVRCSYSRKPQSAHPSLKKIK